MKNRKVIFPGTFDPLTNAHINILTKASYIFDHVLLAIADNSAKSTIFSLKERTELARQALSHLKTVEIISFRGLTAHLAKKKKIYTLLRGIRSQSDLDYEIKLAHANNHIIPNLESIFMITSKKLTFISSSLVKEIIKHGGDAKSMLPNVVWQAILKKKQK